MRLANSVHLQNSLNGSPISLGDLDQRLAALHAVMDDLSLRRLLLLTLRRCHPARCGGRRLIVHLGDFDDGLNRSVRWCLYAITGRQNAPVNPRKFTGRPM